ncbi:MAG: tRNA (adenosine(37)-N6)-threonylcarbamoyltransferase complex dimerization subunit type 1 TsaB [Alphaproteobacteria bacterium]|nr:tRNA (adenosine(37)-N6)-threonylcarbamoyltransferase complex dimerization subunit type 1 TsaB [Alphaproteobacteria bacterium]
MLILVLDSSGSSCGVGVYRDGRALLRLEESMQRGQDARLMPMVMEAMAKAGCDFPDLDRIAVTRGPGSFTGVRVGIAAARGIGRAAHKPVIGIDRFSIYKALRDEGAANLLVVIESKRAELFCKFYPASGEAHEACMMTDDEIKTFLKQHPGTEVRGDIATPKADTLAVCAALAASAELEKPEFLPRPLYLRAPDVTFAKACG